MLVNCDLGESYGAWQMGNDAKVMAFIDQANIATGFHAGDPSVMRQSIELAKQHQIAIGAHPAYPDLQGFGRRSIAIAPDDLSDLLLYQIAALDGMTKSLGTELTYVKPHGALYNDMMVKPSVMTAVLKAIKQFYRPLSLMVQALPGASRARANMNNESEIVGLINDSGVECLYEVFADRRYHDDGRLVSRALPGAVLNQAQLQEQVTSLLTQACVTTLEGNKLSLVADTICIHGDSDSALENAKLVRSLLQKDAGNKDTDSIAGQST